MPRIYSRVYDKVMMGLEAKGKAAMSLYKMAFSSQSWFSLSLCSLSRVPRTSPAPSYLTWSLVPSLTLLPLAVLPHLTRVSVLPQVCVCGGEEGGDCCWGGSRGGLLLPIAIFVVHSAVDVSLLSGPSGLSRPLMSRPSVTPP